VKFPRLRTASNPADETTLDEPEVVEVTSGAYTLPKGRPTPKRREAQGRSRGPVPPPPMTQREAMKRSRGNKVDRRAAATERRARMASGDPKALLPRDRGPVRAYVRDVVDSRRRLIGLFMPLAILVLVAMVAPIPSVQLYAAPGTVVILLLMIVEGLLLGRNVTRRVRVKFPTASDGSLSLGWYSFVRASQIRKLRIPKPIVQPGADIQ
jgi:hypothetical protein